MERITGAKAIVDSLLHEGVDLIFGYPGGTIMPFYDALFDYQDQLRHILVRHEQCAVHAAEGYARVTGKTGVCVATSGPGATNLVTGLADALLDSVPLVCITGQVASSVLGSDAFQETDVIGITMPVTKWNYQVTKADEIADAIAKAFYIAKTGRPGPVVVDITKDAQTNETDFVYKILETLNSYRVKVLPEDENIQKAAQLINKAKRPLILAGHGVIISNAQEELLALAEKAGVPVAVTLHAMACFPQDHELYAGMLGMHGNYAPNRLSNETDVVFAVGMRFDDRVTGRLDKYLPDAHVIHLDIDPGEIDKNVKAEVGIHADAKNALTRMLPEIISNSHKEWLTRFKADDEIELEKVIAPSLQSDGTNIRMAEVVSKVSDKTNGEAIIVSDVGQHQMMAARNYKFRKGSHFVSSGGLGTMGFGLPAAIGCALGRPEKQVISFAGDGSFQMTLQELGTIMQEKLPVKAVILNNGYLGMVRQWQELFFERRYSFTPITSPDFVALCSSYGIKSERVIKPEELDAALQRMIDSEEAYILEVVVAAEENVFPMVPSGASVDEVRLD